MKVVIRGGNHLPRYKKRRRGRMEWIRNGLRAKLMTCNISIQTKRYTGARHFEDSPNLGLEDQKGKLRAQCHEAYLLVPNTNAASEDHH